MAVRPHPSKSKKEPGKWWHIDLWNAGDRQRITFQGSYEDAVATEKALRQTPDSQALVAPKISEMFIPFLDYYKGEAAVTTVVDVRREFSRHLIPYFGKYQPRQIGSLIDKFKQMQLAAGLKHRTINKHLSYLSALIKWGVDQGLCQPVQIRLFSRKRIESPPTRPLTSRQIDVLLKYIQPKYRLIFLLMTDMGLRRNEE